MEETQWKSSDDIIHLSLEGRPFTTTKSTLTKYEDTYFTALLNGNFKSEEVLFIDRSAKYFTIILGFLHNGQIDLDLSDDVKAEALREEARFYGLEKVIFPEDDETFIEIENTSEINLLNNIETTIKFNEWNVKNERLYGNLIWECDNKCDIETELFSENPFAQQVSFMKITPGSLLQATNTQMLLFERTEKTIIKSTVRKQDQSCKGKHLLSLRKTSEVMKKCVKLKKRKK